MPPFKPKPRRAGNKGKRRAPAPAPAKAAADDTESGSENEEESGSSESSCSDEDDPRDYKRGGYHPVSLYQLYNARYRVLCKLGAGAFSTVWLCADEKAAAEPAATPQLVAMKVCKSKKTVTEQAIDEIALLEKLADSSASEPSHVAQLQAHFWHTGPNGRHKCMVFEVMGENLLSLVKYYDYDGLPYPMVKRISRHTLLGLAYIHERGIVHTDVKLENVLIQRHDMRFLIEDAGKAHRAFVEHKDALGALSKSQKKKLKQKQKKAAKNGAAGDAAAPEAAATAAAAAEGSDGEAADGAAPEEAADKAAAEACGKPVPPVRQKERFSSLEVDEVFAKVADFGNGCFLNNKVTDDIQTRQYRSPEVIIGAEWDATADVWSAACMFFELITGDFLFDPRSNKDWSRDEDHLALIIELLGEHPPKDWLLTGKYTRDFFTTSTGKLKHIKKLTFWSLADVLAEKYKVRKKDVLSICDFLLPMLAWLPSKRQAAKDALDARWLSEEDAPCSEDGEEDDVAARGESGRQGDADESLEENERCCEEAASPEALNNEAKEAAGGNEGLGAADVILKSAADDETSSTTAADDQN
mmetsp:Transcript_27326/g.63705  ORF Transcript_27326/g.63705 Transcript_27326/m.63705 type:complete len:585 (+) Transcript_27326:81-1835(+)